MYALRHYITFQTPTTASDSMGGRVPSVDFATVRKTRAKIEPIGGSVEYENGQTRAVNNYEVVTRYLPDYTITHKTKIVWDGREFTPKVPVNIDSVKRWMRFEMSEFVG